MELVQKKVQNMSQKEILDWFRNSADSIDENVEYPVSLTPAQLDEMKDEVVNTSLLLEDFRKKKGENSGLHLSGTTRTYQYSRIE
jgi:hypothetical protein